MPPIAVFFDMDGVLLDSFEAWLALLNTMTRDLGYSPVIRDEFKAVFGQPTSADVERFFPRHTVEEVEAYYAAHFPEHATMAEPLPGARSVLDALDERGAPTAVITNTTSAVARPLLESLELVSNALVGGDDVRNPKPAPDMIFRACEVLDVEPWDVLVVGDSEYDKRAAAAAGSFFAGIGTVSGNFTIASLDEVLSIMDGTHA